MAKEKTIKTKITADNKDFKRGIKQSEKEAKGFQKSTMKLGSALKYLGGAAVIGGAVKGLFNMATELAENSDRLLDLEQQTGLTTDKLQEYEYVSKMAGVSTEAMARASMGMTRRLAGATTASSPLNIALQELGINAKNSSGEMRNGGDVMEEVVDRLAEMTNTTERNVKGAQIFGGAWKDLAPIMAMGADGIEAAKKEARDLGVVMSKEALEGANEYRQSVERLNTTWGVMKRQIGEELIPILNKVTNTLTTAMTTLRKSKEQTELFNSVTDETTKTVGAAAHEVARSPKTWLAMAGAILKGESAMDAIRESSKETADEMKESYDKAGNKVVELIEKYDKWIEKQIEAGREESDYVQAAIKVRNDYARTLSGEAKWLENIIDLKKDEVEVTEDLEPALGRIQMLQKQIKEAEEGYYEASTVSEMARFLTRKRNLEKELELLEKQAEFQSRLPEHERETSGMSDVQELPTLGGDISLEDPNKLNEIATGNNNLADSLNNASDAANEANLNFQELIGTQEQLEVTAIQAATSIGESFAKMAIEGEMATEDIISQLIAQIVGMLMAQAIETIDFPYNIAAAAAAGAVGYALTSNIPAFADGGIVSGPTVGLMGEYANARSNPEVVAPLDRLESMMGGSGKVEFVIKGNNLYGVLNKEANRRNQLGS